MARLHITKYGVYLSHGDKYKRIGYDICNMLPINQVFWIRMKYLKNFKYYKFDSQLIKAAGISEGSWNYWRTSKRLPTIQGILALSDALGVKVGWLLGEIPMESLESEGLR